MTRPASRPDRVAAWPLRLGLGIGPTLELGVEVDIGGAELGTALVTAPAERPSWALELTGLPAHAAIRRMAAARRIAATVGAAK